MFFDGQYRRTPVQSLGGASRNSDRTTLIRKAAEERQKRAEIRRQNDGATRIQSYVRSFIRRQTVKVEQRRLFDELVARKGALTDDSLQVAMQRILFFYYSHNKADGERLVSWSQMGKKNKLIEIFFFRYSSDSISSKTRPSSWLRPLPSRSGNIDWNASCSFAPTRFANRLSHRFVNWVSNNKILNLKTKILKLLNLKRLNLWMWIP